MSNLSDLERESIFMEIEDGITELIETLDNNDVENSNDENLLQIKENLVIIYDIIKDNV